MASKKSAFLNTALHEKTLISFERRFESGNVSGYVLAVGSKFFVLALVSDRVRYDGYECFRIADVRKPRPHPFSSFVEAALRLRHEVRPQYRIEVSSLERLLASAADAFPIITIHDEIRYPESCWIGRVKKIQRGVVSLLHIKPDASWEKEPTDHNLGDITRVNFDGDYERALQLVGVDSR